MRSLAFFSSDRSGALRPAASGLGALGSPEGTPDKREEQREDARDRQDHAEPLLRDALRNLAGRTGQRYAGELIYKAGTHGAAYERQDDGDDQGQQRHQEPCLTPERLAILPAT